MTVVFFSPTATDHTKKIFLNVPFSLLGAGIGLEIINYCQSMPENVGLAHPHNHKQEFECGSMLRLHNISYVNFYHDIGLCNTVIEGCNMRRSLKPIIVFLTDHNSR